MVNTIKSARAAATEQGFSLAEVVVMISLVGIASAFAVPRFTTLANRARASEVVALGASLRTAAQTAHAQYVASGATLSATIFEGKSVQLKNGYPDASPSGIGNAFTDWDGFATKVSPTFVTFFKTGAPADAQCSVTYNAASSQPASVATVSDIFTSGC
jgi:type II secretory pathway pseudopilin PulG